ncbi:hypothetical protein Ddye_006850 [Dipteronia dyeriana]|uniref:Uncharacterized protein n=1 Tax=Dipteronia dyeriana TaxID=168575 RepID=A0AAD9XJE5_9ROSI|nr:hypothetical protein Ddye_006850 [Dipteronia dyeriana]
MQRTTQRTCVQVFERTQNTEINTRDMWRKSVEFSPIYNQSVGNMHCDQRGLSDRAIVLRPVIKFQVSIPLLLEFGFPYGERKRRRNYMKDRSKSRSQCK